MTNMLKNNDFASVVCDNAPQGGKIVSDGPGKRQVRSGLQRISAQFVTNKPERQYRAGNRHSKQQRLWRSRTSSRGPIGPLTRLFSCGQLGDGK